MGVRMWGCADAWMCGCADVGMWGYADVGCKCGQGKIPGGGAPTNRAVSTNRIDAKHAMPIPNQKAII